MRTGIRSGVWSGNVKQPGLSWPISGIAAWSLTIGSVLTSSFRQGTRNWKYAIGPSTVGRPKRVACCVYFRAPRALSLLSPHRPGDSKFLCASSRARNDQAAHRRNRCGPNFTGTVGNERPMCYSQVFALPGRGSRPRQNFIRLRVGEPGNCQVPIDFHFSDLTRCDIGSLAAPEPGYLDPEYIQCRGSVGTLIRSFFDSVQQFVNIL